MLLKNTAGKLPIFAYDLATGSGVTGIAASITGYLSKDAAAPSVFGTPNPSEIGNGWYAFTTTATETNANLLSWYATATGVNVFIRGDSAYTDPTGVTLLPGQQIFTDISNLNTAITAGVASTLLATGYILSTGSVISNSYTATYLSNGSGFVLAPTANGLNLVLGYVTGLNQYINSVTIRGFFSAGAGRYCNVSAWNWINNSWDQLSDSITRMNNASTNQSYNYTLLSNHQKIDGTVHIGFQSPSTNVGDRLSIDQCIINVATAGASAADIANAVWLKTAAINYEGGVTIDTINGESGSLISNSFGSPSRPTKYYADALNIADNLGVKRFYFRPDSEISLTRSHDYWRFIGKGKINLNGQSIADAIFEDSELVSGTGVDEDMDFHNCVIGDITLCPCLMQECSLAGSISCTGNGNYTLHSCYDYNPGYGPTPTIIFGSGAAIGLRNYRGGLSLSGMGPSNSLKIDGAGRVVLDAACSGGNITIRGDFPPITGNSYNQFIAGGGSITQTQRYGTDQNVAGIIGVSFPAQVASPTNITYASGIILADDQHVIVDSGLVDANVIKINSKLIDGSVDVSNRPNIYLKHVNINNRNRD